MDNLFKKFMTPKELLPTSTSTMADFVTIPAARRCKQLLTSGYSTQVCGRFLDDVNAAYCKEHLPGAARVVASPGTWDLPQTIASSNPPLTSSGVSDLTKKTETLTLTGCDFVIHHATGSTSKCGRGVSVGSRCSRHIHSREREPVKYRCEYVVKRQNGTSEPCNRKALDEHKRCGMHSSSGATKPVRSSCEHVVNGREGKHLCIRKAAEGQRYCSTHLGSHLEELAKK